MKRRITLAIVGIVMGLLFAATPASAYEWQNGPGKSCGSGWVQIGAFVYGDGNLYSNYGREYYYYGVPYWTQQYLFTTTLRHSITASAAEAENYVSSGPGTDCSPV